MRKETVDGVRIDPAFKDTVHDPYFTLQARRQQKEAAAKAYADSVNRQWPPRQEQQSSISKKLFGDRQATDFYAGRLAQFTAELQEIDEEITAQYKLLNLNVVQEAIHALEDSSGC